MCSPRVGRRAPGAHTTAGQDEDDDDVDEDEDEYDETGTRTSPVLLRTRSQHAAAKVGWSF